MKRILLIVNTDGALYVFRRPIIEQLLLSGHEVESISGKSDYFEKLKRIGVEPHALEFDRHSASPIGNLLLIFGLSRLVRGIRPDIVHSFTHKPAVYGTIAAKLSGAKKIFVTVTGLGTLFVKDDFRSRVLRSLLLAQYRVALLFADTVFFQNPDDREYFVSRRLLPGEKAVLTNGSGINLAEVPDLRSGDILDARRRISAEVGLDMAQRKMVLYPARAVREKGLVEFYGAAKDISERFPHDYMFIHLGHVDELTATQFGGLGIDGFAKQCHVLYLGFKENILDYMSAADIVALPSYREGVPRSLIEALALGKPIITTDVPGCREVVVSGWNGHLCEPRSVASLVEAILRVDEDLYQNVEVRAKALCREKFDADKLVAMTFERYFSEAR